MTSSTSVTLSQALLARAISHHGSSSTSDRVSLSATLTLPTFSGLKSTSSSPSSSSSKSSPGATYRDRIDRVSEPYRIGAVSDRLIPPKSHVSVQQSAEGFSSIPEAIEDIRQGKMVIVVDDEDRENEGDLIMAASLATPEAMAFIVKHGTGIVCVSMKGEDLKRLQLPLMVTQKENEEKLSTAFTVSVDAKRGTTTGVSARDRAVTVLALASRNSKPEDFNRPGHIFPLKYREGGVLKRAGHTEASVDLAMLAGQDPVAVLCEIVDDDGSMARLPKLRQFAQAENLKIISIADLIRYRRKRDKLVERAGVARIPTMWGPFEAYCYKSLLDGIEHIAMVKGSPAIILQCRCSGTCFDFVTCDCFYSYFIAHFLELIFEDAYQTLLCT